MKDPIYSPESRSFIGTEIKFTTTEAKIFECLWDSNDYVSKKDMMKQIWGGVSDKVYLTLRVQINSIKKKIKPLGLGVDNQHGFGYKVVSK